MTVRVHLADWLDLARALPPRSIDFLYADPPFNTGRTHRTPPRTRTGAATAFADSWSDMRSYLAFLRERLDASLPALKPSAVLAIHGDYRAAHHIRLLLDDLLGPQNFVNHLVWHYGLGGSSPRRFARKHDDILVYSLDQASYYFDPPRVPATSHRLRGQTKKATDVIDLPALNNMARERTGYPTQKPVALLELLVGAFCPPGGTVLDPCCGSGTTLVAAMNLGRDALGCDVNPDAVAIARRRLATRASVPRRPG